MLNVNREERSEGSEVRQAEPASTECGYRMPSVVELGDTTSQINGQSGAYGDGTYRTDRNC